MVHFTYFLLFQIFKEFSLITNNMIRIFTYSSPCLIQAHSLCALDCFSLDIIVVKVSFYPVGLAPNFTPDCVLQDVSDYILVLVLILFLILRFCIVVIILEARP